MDAGFAGSETKLPEPLEVAGLPGGHAFTDTLVFTVEMLRPAGEAGRHLVLPALVGDTVDVAQEGLVEGLDRAPFVSQDIPGRCLAFSDTEVEIAPGQVARQAGEEDADLKIWHLRVPADQAVVVRVAVQHQKMVFPAQGDAGLVQDAVLEADVFALRLRGDANHFETGQGDVIRLRESHHIREQDGCARGDAADRERAFEHASDAAFQGETLLEGVFHAAGIVAPVVLADDGRLLDGEVDGAVEREAAQRHAAVIGRRIHEIDAQVDGKARHQAVLVVDVRTQGADAIGAEDVLEVGVGLTEVLDIGFFHFRSVGLQK